MKKFVSKNLTIVILSSVLVISTSLLLYAYPTGITGRTKKTSTTGCSCHTQNTAITGAITGPDTVVVGSTNTYTITINRSGYSGAHGGVDIAVRLGTLDATPSGGLLRVQSGELTHNNPLTFSGGITSVNFSYIAPGMPGIDTIWSNVAAGYSNGWNYSPEKRVVVKTLMGIPNSSEPVSFNLNQNYPNPFNPNTIFSFSIPKESAVSLTIYDILGNKVDNILTGKLPAGNHEVSWKAGNFASGIYFYTLKAGDMTMTKKMILAK